MKAFKVILLAGIICLANISFADNSQKSKKRETITIKVSSQCEMCKNAIEKTLAYEKGVISSDVDYKGQTAIVVYNPQKTTPDAIRTAISKIGYDADSVHGDAKAYAKLPSCCKKPEDQHQHSPGCKHK